jgi:hypothetical protein
MRRSRVATSPRSWRSSTPMCRITPPTLPWSRGDYAGPDGVAQYFQSFAEALDDAAVEPHELIEGGATAFADSR